MLAVSSFGLARRVHSCPEKPRFRKNPPPHPCRRVPGEMDSQGLKGAVCPSPEWNEESETSPTARLRRLPLVLVAGWRLRATHLCRLPLRHVRRQLLCLLAETGFTAQITYQASPFTALNPELPCFHACHARMRQLPITSFSGLAWEPSM
mgnify:CR=1 FL=1